MKACYINCIVVDFLKLLLTTSRPIYWLGPIFIFIAGQIASRDEWSFLSVWGLLFVTAPMGLIVYGLNDIADIASDQINERKGGIEGNIVKSKEIPLIKKIVLIIFFLSTAPMILLGKYLMILPVALITIFAYVYSFQPLRLKNRPILDSVSNACWMLFIFLLGYASSVKSIYGYILVPRFVWFIFLGVIATHALTTVWDYEVDKKIGDHTISGLLTKRGAIILALVIYTFILLFLRPINFPVIVYLVVAIVACLNMLIWSNKKIIYYGTWTILLSFPLLSLYLVIFENTFLKALLD